MKLRRTKHGDRELRKLDPSLRRRAEEALTDFLGDILPPGLNFEKLRGYDDLYSLRVNRNYRIILLRDAGHVFEIVRIGPHDSYDRLGGDD